MNRLSVQETYNIQENHPGFLKDKSKYISRLSQNIHQLALSKIRWISSGKLIRSRLVAFLFYLFFHFWEGGEGGGPKIGKFSLGRDFFRQLFKAFGRVGREGRGRRKWFSADFGKIGWKKHQWSLVGSRIVSSWHVFQNSYICKSESIFQHLEGSNALKSAKNCRNASLWLSKQSRNKRKPF